MQIETLLAVGALASTALALGINCRGSARCAEGGAKVNVNTGLGDSALPQLEAALENGVKYHTPHKHYPEGAPIVCTAGTCAFFQGGASGTPIDALKLIRQLRAHGCDDCGSVPVNSTENGEFTVNYRYMPGPQWCGNGDLCPVDGPDPDGTKAQQARESRKAMMCDLAEGEGKFCED